MNKRFYCDNIAWLFGLVFLVLAIASWLTHIIVCIKHSEWLFLIAGAIFIPVSWVHGVGVWLGYW